MNTVFNYKNIIAVALLLLAVTFAMLVVQEPNNVHGSIRVGDEYFATSTAASTVYGATITADTLVKRGQGSLNAVVVLGANTGVVNIYDATTTSVLARTGNKATSTILLASLPASLAAGTYTFDLIFTDGLYFDIVSGNMPTTTVTYR